MNKEAVILSLTLDGEAASNQLGEDLATILRAGDCLLLTGDLGAGKTTIARALIRAVLNDDEAEVPSPTFTLVNVFEEARVPLSHFDLYRINDPDELEEIGFHESLKDGITLVEWPERATSEMPATALRLSISGQGDKRQVDFFGQDEWPERIDRCLMIRAFLNRHGWQSAVRRFLQGDASSRSYEKVRHAVHGEAVLMNSPAMADGPVVKDGKRYSQLAHLAEDVRAFVAIGETLRERGFPAPELVARDMDSGVLLTQDFGSKTLLTDGKPDFERYKVAIDILTRMHGIDWPQSVNLPDGTSYVLARFDQSVFDIEISLFTDWYAPHVANTLYCDDVKADYVRIWQALFEVVSTGETSWILRDYHSPNLMWRPDEKGEHRIGLIDYQDALIGPSAYDVASLCQDARQTISVEMEKALKTHYINQRRDHTKPFDVEAFERDYAIIAAERGTRLLGLWPRLKHRDGKPDYMQHMPRTKEYLRRALTHPVLSDLKHWFDKNAVL